MSSEAGSRPQVALDRVEPAGRGDADRVDILLADGDDDLEVALHLRLGAARPHDDACPLGQRVAQAVRGRKLGRAEREVVDALDREAAELTRALAAAPASALAVTKQLFYQLDGQTFDQGIALGARVNALVRQTPDFRDAIGRFLTKT